MSQSKKNNKGFTLVEVIVVAVIVAILAAVAIPIYQQYVIDSRDNAAKNTGGAVASFLGACNAAGGTLPTATTLTGQVQCTGLTNPTEIAIPTDITVTVNYGTKIVSSKHVKSASTMDYNY